MKVAIDRRQQGGGTEFEGGRHARRVGQIDAIERAVLDATRADG